MDIMVHNSQDNPINILKEDKDFLGIPQKKIYELTTSDNYCLKKDRRVIHRVTMSDNEWFNKSQRITMSGYFG